MPHISFSAIKNWDFCPYYHKLTFIDKIKIFEGNIYTAFGTALHSTCEKVALNESIEPTDYFSERFTREINNLKIIKEKEEKILSDMKIQGRELASLILKALKVKFPEYKVFSAEEQVFQPINDIEIDYSYKGFLDLVIQTPDGKYHIIDWKSCSWGWDLQKRSDPLTTYQLTYYKKFFCEKHNIDPSMVETHFGLLKRTAKKERVEIFRVSSGPRKTKNALKILNNAVYNIDKNNHPKNRLKCSQCEFRNSEHCT